MRVVNSAYWVSTGLLALMMVGNERGLANLRRHCEQLAAARPAPVAPALAAAH